MFVASRGVNIETCGISHWGDPVALEPKTLYILRHTSPTPHILLSPCFDARRLTQEFLVELLQEQHDLSEWAQIFWTIRVTLSQTSGLLSHASHDEHQRFLNQPLRTPGGPRACTRLFAVETVQESETEDDNFVSATEASLWDNIPELPEVSIEQFSTEDERASAGESLPEWLLRSLEAIQEVLTEHGSNNLTMHREIISRWILLADDLKRLEAKSALLGELVGSPGGVHTVDLWSSVRHLFEQASSPQGITPSFAELSMKIDNLGRSLSEAASRVSQLESANAKLTLNHASLSVAHTELTKRVDELSSQLVTTLGTV